MEKLFSKDLMFVNWKIGENNMKNAIRDMFFLFFRRKLLKIILKTKKTDSNYKKQLKNTKYSPLIFYDFYTN